MSLASRARALVALSLCSLAPAPARAGDGGAEGAPSVTADEVVVRLPRAASAPTDPTAAATVVDVRRYEGEAKGVAELVSTAPGVAVNGYGGLGQLATVSIRGSAAEGVQVLLDGLPLGTAAGGAVDLSRIPRGWIESLEIVRGSEGGGHGPGALGGAVNIVTRAPEGGAWSVEGSGGSFRTFDAAADGAVGGAGWGLLGALAGTGTGGAFPYLFDPTLATGGGATERVRVHNAAASGGALAKGWARAGAGRLDVALQLSGGTRELPGSPYHLTPADGQDDRRAAVTARWAMPLADGVHLVAGASGRADELDVRIDPLPEARQRGLEAGAGAGVVAALGPGVASLRVDARGERLEVRGAPSRGRAALAVALSDDVALGGGALRVRPALRWDAEGPYRGLSAKLGAVVRIAGPLAARASAGRTFRAPSFAELFLVQGLLSANPDLAPETAVSGDAGLVLEDRRGQASASVFAQLYRDLIVYEADSFRRLKPFNDGKAVARGLELEASTAPLGPAGVSARAAYTLLATETLRGDASVLGKALPHRARHRLFARVGAGRTVAQAHAEAQLVSEAFGDLRNSPALRIPPAFTLAIGGALRVLRRPLTHLDLELRNLLDDRSLQDGFGNPLPGRMVTLTVRIAGGKDAPP